MKRVLLAALLLLLSPPVYAKTMAIVGVALDQSSASPGPLPQKLSVASGETGEIDIAITHPSGAPYDLTGAQVTFSVGLGGSKISRQATIVSAAAGTAKVPLVIADTLSMLGTYTYDVTLTAVDGSFYRVVPASAFVVTAGIGQPGQAVTVPATQQPLAQGPAGAAGATSIGHIESGQSTITEGSGAGHDWLDVTFNAPFAAATGSTGYNVDAQISLTTSTDPTVGWSVTNKTTTGMTIQFSSTFAGEVRWKAYDIAISTAVLPNPAPSIIAGTGLTGGGALTGNQTLSIASTVPICTPTTAGDYCGWSGSAWVREPAPTGGGGGGTVTSIGIGTGLASTQTPLTTTGTMSIATTGVGAGSCTNCSLTYNAQGQLTAASSGAGGGGTQAGTTSSPNVPYASGANTLANSELQFTPATHTFSVGASTVLDMSASSSTIKAPTGGMSATGALKLIGNVSANVEGVFVQNGANPIVSFQNLSAPGAAIQFYDNSGSRLYSLSVSAGSGFSIRDSVGNPASLSSVTVISSTLNTAASAATVAITRAVNTITGTVSVSTLTLPFSGFVGSVKIITPSILSFIAGGNIATSGQITTAAGQVYDATYDGTSWYIK